MAPPTEAAAHPWLFRFAFPGFAEAEWVLPEGVDHPEPWYERLPASLACHDLDRWALDPLCHGSLRELHEAMFGLPLVEPAGVPFHRGLGDLRAAFERGSLVAWVIRVNTVAAPATILGELPLPKPLPGTTKTWIEIVLVDDKERPVANERFAVKVPDGTTRTGRLDERGFVRIDGIDAGPCDVTFPDIDGREWGR